MPLDGHPVKLWIWKNFVDGRPEYWAFDNAYPCKDSPFGDPITLGPPSGYAIFKPSFRGRHDVSDEQVVAEIKQRREQFQEEVECAHKALDDRKAPRMRDGEPLSLVGRIKAALGEQ